jgi:predicted DNA-binding transcriptional regulator AlpA
MTTVSDDSLMNAQAVGDKFGVSKSLIYKWVKHSEIQPDFPAPVDVTQSGGGKFLFVKSEIDAFFQLLIDQRRTAPIDTHAEKRALPTAKMSADEQRIYNNRRLGRDDSFVEEEDFLNE